MYSLESCPYYNKKFEHLDDLIQDVITSGMDPNYYIYHNGEKTDEMVADLIQE